MSPQLAPTPEKQLVTAETLTRQIVPSAILAPSAHNTQPWKFTTSSNSLDIFIDWDRHLAVSDPDLRQLYISIGCAIANAKIAGQYWNNDVDINYFPAGEAKDKPVARLTFTPNSNDDEHDEDAGELFAAIEQRHTDRTNYDKKPLTEQEQTSLQANVDLDITQVVTNRDHITKIAKLTEEGTFKTLSRKDFKEELSHWVRNSWTHQHDGMPGYAMGIPAPMSLVAPIMVRVAPIHIQEAPKIREQTINSSAVVLFSTPTDTPTDWLKVGQQLQLIWLNATTAGLAAMPIVASIEAGDQYRDQLKTITGTNKYPQSLLRIGHSSKSNLKPTPRRTLTECLA